MDRNPYKQGKFTPGTRIPIHAPERIRETRPDYVLILPWNLKDEIMGQMAYVREWGGRFVVPIPEVTVYGDRGSRGISPRPRVSIGMPVYNGARFIAETLDSILAQSFPDWELIISDNASTDHTPEICRDYAAHDHRIRYERNSQNIGARVTSTGRSSWPLPRTSSWPTRTTCVSPTSSRGAWTPSIRAGRRCSPTAGPSSSTSRGAGCATTMISWISVSPDRPIVSGSRVSVPGSSISCRASCGQTPSDKRPA